MKPKLIPVLEMCIESGIEAGWHRAHKHSDSPTAPQIQQEIERQIWLCLDEWFDFQETRDEQSEQ